MVLKKSSLFGALSYVVFCISPFLVVLSTFGTYVLMENRTKILDAKTLFGGLAYINILRMPMTMMSPAVMVAVQVHDKYSPKSIINLLLRNV